MKNKRWAIWLNLLLVLGGQAEGAEPIRCAIVVDRGDALRSSPLVSLLEARLSQDSHLALVERERINAVLREQHVSLAGAADPNLALRAGKLLRAEVLVLLGTENAEPAAGVTPPGGRVPTGSPAAGMLYPFWSQGLGTYEAPNPPNKDKPVEPLLRVRIVETAHGLRLWERFEPLAESQPEAAERVAKGILAVVGKVRQSRGQVVPLGIVDVRRVQLSEKYEGLVRVLPALLSARLGQEPDLLLLERENLGVLLREKQLTAGEDAAFWNSAVLIDGYVQPDPNAGMQVRLRLRRFDGGEIKAFAVALDPNSPSAAVEKAAAAIRETIGNTRSAASWDAATEAQEFHREGQLLYAHHRNTEAVPPFEVAHALQPGNVLYTGSLFLAKCACYGDALRSRSISDANRLHDSELEIAELAAMLVRQIRDQYEKRELAIPGSSEPQAPAASSLTGYFGSRTSVATEQVRQINRASRKLWVETYGKILLQQPPAPTYPLGTRFARGRLAWISSDEPQELLVNLKRTFTELVMPKELGGQIASSHLEDRRRAYDQVFRIPFGPQTSRHFKDSQLGDSGEVFWNLWLDYLAEVSEFDDPVVQVGARSDLVHASAWPPDGKATARAMAQACEAVRLLADQIQAAGNEYNTMLGNQAGNLKKYVFFVLSKYPEESLELWISVYKPLVERKAVFALAMWRPGWSDDYVLGGKPTPEATRRWHELLQQVAEVLDAQRGAPQVPSALGMARRALTDIPKSHPEMVVTQAASHPPVTMLLRKEQWIVLRGSLVSSSRGWQVELDGEMLWISGKTTSIQRDSVFGLAGINLAKRKATKLWQAAFTSAYGIFPYVTAAVTGETVSYVFVRDIGLVEFPGTRVQGRELFADAGNAGLMRNLSLAAARLKEGDVIRVSADGKGFGNSSGLGSPTKPKVLTQDNGLPSLFVTSMAWQGDKLWIAYGGQGAESGLGLYDPRTGRWETVFCSTVAGEAPFGIGKPYEIRSLKVTAAGTLLFTLNDFAHTGTSEGPWCGLWSLDTATRKARFLGWGEPTPPRAWPYVADVQGKWWVWSPDRHGRILEFDPQTETWSRREGDLCLGLSSTSRPLENVVLHEDVLWGLWRPNQLVAVGRGKHIKEGRFMDNTILNGEPVIRFLSTPYGLVAIGDGIVGLVETADTRSPSPK